MRGRCTHGTTTQHLDTPVQADAHRAHPSSPGLAAHAYAMSAHDIQPIVQTVHVRRLTTRATQLRRIVQRHCQTSHACPAAHHTLVPLPLHQHAPIRAQGCHAPLLDPVRDSC